jgi:hypothetical protein
LPAFTQHWALLYLWQRSQSAEKIATSRGTLVLMTNNSKEQFILQFIVVDIVSLIPP